MPTERLLSARLWHFCRMPADPALNSNHHSPHRQIIALRIEHADLHALIDQHAGDGAFDELLLRRLEKRRLVLRDAIECLERELAPPEPA